ncbi:MAG TPA: DUF6036 family nucleotidyltransferase [Thermoanaerobaculia bacterium]
MKRSELEHVLRAAGAITGVSTWVVVGSQAILGALPNAPPELLFSQDADVYAPDDESASDLVDGSIGESSLFHESFGYYGHGVGAKTAILPNRWRERSVTIHSPATGGVTGICPSPADLAISKVVAWREKDQKFVRALIEHRIVNLEGLQALVGELDPEVGQRVRQRLTAFHHS